MRVLVRATILVLSLAIVLTAGIPKTSEIRRVDFRNFMFPWDEEMGETSSVPPISRWISPLPQGRIRTVRGRHHFYSPDQDEYEREFAPVISTNSVTYGDLDGDGMEEAAVHLNYSTGGTQNWDFLYIYKLSRGRPRLLAVLEAVRAPMVALCGLPSAGACWYSILPMRRDASVIVARKAISESDTDGKIKASLKKGRESAAICL